jgi:hypothetical protein
MLRTPLSTTVGFELQQRLISDCTYIKSASLSDYALVDLALASCGSQAEHMFLARSRDSWGADNV